MPVIHVGGDAHRVHLEDQGVGVGGAIQNSLQGLVGDGPDSVRIGAIAAFGGLAALLATYCLWLMQRSVAKARSPNRAGPCLYAPAGAGWGGWGVGIARL